MRSRIGTPTGRAGVVEGRTHVIGLADTVLGSDVTAVTVFTCGHFWLSDCGSLRSHRVGSPRTISFPTHPPWYLCVPSAVASVLASLCVGAGSAVCLGQCPLAIASLLYEYSL